MRGATEESLDRSALTGIPLPGALSANHIAPKVTQ